MARPTIRTNAPASHYAGSNETIAEFSNGSRTGLVGGLLAMRTGDDGTLHLSIYRTDPGVRVSVGAEDGSSPYMHALRDITAAMLTAYNADPEADRTAYLRAVAALLERENVISDQTTLKCPECPEECTDLTDLQEHMNDEHDGRPVHLQDLTL